MVLLFDFHVKNYSLSIMIDWIGNAVAMTSCVNIADLKIHSPYIQSVGQE